MSNFKSVPNQKTIQVKKEVCDKNHIYAAINIEAMNHAACDLDAGAFKLWIYFAKNQDGFTFALSSKEVENSFGMKIKQYNNAVAQLIEKGYLIQQEGNYYIFSETPVMPKGNNDVIPKGNKDVMPKGNNPLSQKVIRNNTINNTINTTINNTEEKEEEVEEENEIEVRLYMGANLDLLHQASTLEERGRALGF